MADSLFVTLADGRTLPTELSRGPWSPNALHGGPVAALVAHAGEAALAATGADAATPVRLTLDLERPVPLAPLLVSSEIVRRGRKVQVAEVTVHDEAGTRLVRASVLAIRRHEVDLPEDRPRPEDPTPPPPDESGARWNGGPFGDGLTSFVKDAVTHQLVPGALPGSSTVIDWIRLEVNVLDDHPPSPFQRVLAAADFSNGISAVLPFDEWTFINPDLTVTLHRMPVGEWVAIEAASRLEPDGVGTAESILHDAGGRLGHCVQTLLVEPR
jgi:hypothetical protein